jgi:enoyl-CoA hydratase/carnithine racemase
MSQAQLPHSLQTEFRDRIAFLRLSRPQKRNAMDAAMIAGLGQFFSNLPEGTRAVLVHAEGDHFSAGLDFGDLSDTDATQGMLHSRLWHRNLAPIEQCDVPVIAVLKGAVVGGGLELAAACHIRVAEQSAFYALPEGQRGLFVGGGASVRVPRLVGVARMMDMMLTGRTYGAQEGNAIGLSQYLVENGEGLAKGEELARRVAENASITNFAVLHALPSIAEADPRIGLVMESLMAGIASSSEEAKSRMRDFLEKRGAKVRHQS